MRNYELANKLLTEFYGKEPDDSVMTDNLRELVAFVIEKISSNENKQFLDYLKNNDKNTYEKVIKTCVTWKAVNDKKDNIIQLLIDTYNKTFGHNITRQSLFKTHQHKGPARLARHLFIRWLLVEEELRYRDIAKIFGITTGSVVQRYYSLHDEISVYPKVAEQVNKFNQEMQKTLHERQISRQPSTGISIC